MTTPTTETTPTPVSPLAQLDARRAAVQAAEADALAALLAPYAARREAARAHVAHILAMAGGPRRVVWLEALQALERPENSAAALRASVPEPYRAQPALNARTRVLGAVHGLAAAYNNAMAAQGAEARIAALTLASFDATLPADRGFRAGPLGGPLATFRDVAQSALDVEAAWAEFEAAWAAFMAAVDELKAVPVPAERLSDLGTFPTRRATRATRSVGEEN